MCVRFDLYDRLTQTQDQSVGRLQICLYCLPLLYCCIAAEDVLLLFLCRCRASGS